MKIFLTILTVVILTSCKHDYVCSCKDFNAANGQTTEISREVIHDTKQNAKRICAVKECGDECGCALE